VLSMGGCFFWLTVVTLLISVLSDYVMATIKTAAKQLAVSAAETHRAHCDSDAPSSGLATLAVGPRVWGDAEWASSGSGSGSSAHLTATTAVQVPMPFLTTILVPIVGNAAEHASAIVFAYKNRIEISLGVAVGSSTQVSWARCARG
jgi:Ca2+/Na+ antiporter